MLTMRLLIVAALVGPVLYGDDITISLADGEIVITDARFIRLAGPGLYIPELSFKIENRTSLPWWTVDLRFDITGVCNGKPRNWSVPATTSLGWSEDHFVGNVYREVEDSFDGHVDGCRAETIKATLLVAKNANRRIVGPEQAKKEAAEAVRRKQLAAKQRRKDAEADARYATMKAEEDAKGAEERRKVKATCKAIYQNTIDKRVKDLTVREEQQVRACQALGLYPLQ